MPDQVELSKSGVKVAGGKGKGKADPLKEAMEKFAREGGTQEETEQRSPARRGRHPSTNGVWPPKSV